jgi:phenylalanyl-tRNA synthetase beta chain
MGGASSEVTPATTDVLLESAHFDPVTVARTARRHKLSTEASRRFERGVDETSPPPRPSSPSGCSSSTAAASPGRSRTSTTGRPAGRSA